MLAAELSEQGFFAWVFFGTRSAGMRASVHRGFRIRGCGRVFAEPDVRRSGGLLADPRWTE